MIIGYTFNGVSYPAAPFAKMTEQMLNYNEGVIDGISLSNTSNLITIGEGRMIVKGRQFKVLESESVNVSATQSGTLYCRLIVEIDLNKESNKVNFKQVQFKVVSSSSNYPTLTKQDINSEKANDKIYQYELARFKNTSSGISNFQDMRTFIDLDSVLNQMNNRFESFLSEFRTKITNVENGSAYLMKSNVEFIEQVADSTNSCVVNYPSGFNVENTIILSIQCGINNTMWKDYFSKVTSLNYGKNNILINFSENISNIVRVILMKIPGC